MSTTFTKTSKKTAPPTPLNVLFQQAARWFTISVLNLLEEKGYPDLTEPHLNLIANLECGSTYASAVATQMGVSRQAIYRTTRELQKMGILQLVEDPNRRNQKIIEMSEQGMVLAIDAREVIEVIEKELATRIGAGNLDVLRRSLEKNWKTALA